MIMTITTTIIIVCSWGQRELKTFTVQKLKIIVKAQNNNLFYLEAFSLRCPLTFLFSFLFLIITFDIFIY